MINIGNSKCLIDIQSILRGSDLISCNLLVSLVEEDAGVDVCFAIVGSQIADSSPFPVLVVELSVSNFNGTIVGFDPAIYFSIEGLFASADICMAIEASVVHYVLLSTFGLSSELDVINGYSFSTGSSASEV